MLKRVIGLSLSFVLLFNMSWAACAVADDEQAYMEIYVSEAGDDGHEGTENSPLKTIKAARDVVRRHNSGMKGDIVVNVMPGTYYQDEMLEFSCEDSGFNGHSVIYRGHGTPVISGGKRIDTFKKSEDHPGLVEAYLPDVDFANEFYVNGDKKRIAQTEVWFNPSDYRASGSSYLSDGIYVSKEDIPMFSNPRDVEFDWFRGWVHTRVRALDVMEDPTNKERLIVRFKNPDWNDYVASTSSSPTAATPYTTCFAKNAIEFLDTPGEFYFDKNEKKLYYMLEEGESIENSQFTVPVLDTGVFIMGKTTEDRVKNITFDGFKFTNYTIWNDFDEIASSGQGPYYRDGYNGRRIEQNFGTIYLNRAENVNFYNNVFTGLGQAALNFDDAVSNCTVEGNVFYDLNEEAIEAGSQYHIEFEFTDDDERSKMDKFNIRYYVEENPKTDFYMMLLKPYIWSSNVKNKNRVALGINNPESGDYIFRPHTGTLTTSVEDFTDYKKYGNDITWRDIPENGEIPYVMYDFVKKYTFSEITLAFKAGDVSDDEKSKYEVLLSNDRYFKEYTTVAVQNAAPGEVADYKVSDSGKYRYLMIRSLESKPMAITSVYAFTPDIQNQIVRKMCDNIMIRNNYITRTGDTVYSGIGVNMIACENLTFEHNEMSDMPYSAFSYGYNWQYYGKGGKGVIRNNYVNNICTLGYDGAAFYTLGHHVGSVIEENYVYNTNLGGNIYLDNGTNGVFVNNNVNEFTRASLIHNTGAVNNTIGAMFTTCNSNELSNKDEIKWLEEQTEFTVGNESAEILDIKNNAGLETEYEGIRNIVSEKPMTTNTYNGYLSNCDIVKHRRPVYHSNMYYALNNIAENAEFGSGFGQYSSEAKNLLSKLSDYREEGAKNTNTIHELAEKVMKLQNRIGFEELKEKCNEVLAQPADEKLKDTFKKKIESLSKGDGAELLELEKAYNDFASQLQIPSINDAYVNGVRCGIDYEKKQITVNADSDISASDILIEPALNTVIASRIYDLKLGGAQKLSICAKGSKIYDEWEIVSAEKNSETVCGNKIITDSIANDRVRVSGDGSTAFLPFGNYRCYYFDGMINPENENSVRFKINNSSENNRVCFMLGAKTLKGFVPGDNNAIYDRIEIEFFNQILNIYYVKSGTRTLAKSFVCNLRYNSENILKFRMNLVGKNTFVNLSLNGIEYRAAVASEFCGERFGFYSAKNTVMIY